MSNLAPLSLARGSPHGDPFGASASVRSRRSLRRNGRADHVLRHGTEPPLGAHLVTPRLAFAHHGIYVGDGRVVHYGSLTHRLPGGPVEEVSLARFAQGHRISVRLHGAPRFSCDEVIRRARSRVGEDSYRLFSNNCEHFCEWCLHGQQRSYQVEYVLLVPLLTRVALAAVVLLRSLASLFPRAWDARQHLGSSFPRRFLVSHMPMGAKSCEPIKVLLLLVCAACVPRPADAQSFCDSCQVQVGLGGTYHYWGETGSLVLPGSLTWSDNRYELAAFRFTDQQLLPLRGTHRERRMAGPYWGASLSRRWQIFERGPVQGSFGFGLAGRTESDELSITRWDFASQLRLRLRLPGNRVIAEVTMRHWSNGGIRLPNHGQDFATLTVRLNSGLFGIGKENHYAINPSSNREHLLAFNEFGLEGRALP